MSIFIILLKKKITFLDNFFKASKIGFIDLPLSLESPSETESSYPHAVADLFSSFLRDSFGISDDDVTLRDFDLILYSPAISLRPDASILTKTNIISALRGLTYSFGPDGMPSIVQENCDDVISQSLSYL